jgi:hypothetical protein
MGKIAKLEFYHGAAMLRLVRGLGRTTIENLPAIHPSLYLVQGLPVSVGVILKLSVRPKRVVSRWGFIFTENEEAAIGEFWRLHPRARTYFALVCTEDGVCCLSVQDVVNLQDRAGRISGAFVSVKRREHGSYHVNGPGRIELERAVPQSDWPELLTK